jgi:hypothetical protein
MLGAVFPEHAIMSILVPVILASVYPLISNWAGKQIRLHFRMPMRKVNQEDFSNSYKEKHKARLLPRCRIIVDH